MSNRMQGSLVLLLGCLLLQAWATQAQTGTGAGFSSDVIGIEETLQSAEDGNFDIAAALHKKARKQGKCVHKKQVVECSTPGSYDPSKSNRNSHASSGPDPVYHKKQATKYDGQSTSDSSYASPPEEDSGSAAPGAYQSGKQHHHKNKQGSQAGLESLQRPVQEAPTEAEVSYGESYLNLLPTKKKKHKHKSNRSHSGAEQQGPHSQQYDSDGYGSSSSPSSLTQYDESSYDEYNVPAPAPKPKNQYEESEEGEEYQQAPTPPPSRKHKSYKHHAPPPSPPHSSSSSEYEEYDVTKAYKHHRRSSRWSSQHAHPHYQPPTSSPPSNYDDSESYNQPPPSPPSSTYHGDSEDDGDSKTDKEAPSSPPHTQKHRSGSKSYKHSSRHKYEDESAGGEGGDDGKQTSDSYNGPSPPPFNKYDEYQSYKRPPPPASYKYEEYEGNHGRSHKAPTPTPAPKYPVDDAGADDDGGEGYRVRDSPAHSRKKSAHKTTTLVQVESEADGVEGTYKMDAVDVDAHRPAFKKEASDSDKPQVPPTADTIKQQAHNATQVEKASVDAQPYGLDDAKYWQTLSSNENNGKSEQGVAA